MPSEDWKRGAERGVGAFGRMPDRRAWGAWRGAREEVSRALRRDVAGVREEDWSHGSGFLAVQTCEHSMNKMVFATFSRGMRDCFYVHV